MRTLSYLRETARDLLVPAPGQVPALDALRTAAILSVILNHYGVIAVPASLPELGGFADLPPVKFGWTGVDLFFVLSGFLIGRQLWREFERTGSINFWRFILRRGMRIWPLYFAFIAISILLAQSWHLWWVDATFVSNYFSGYVKGGWSLSTEEQFYILGPLAILALSRLLRLRGWLLGLPALLALIQCSRYFGGAALLARGFSRSDVKTLMYEPLHLHSEGLLVGMFIALVSVLRPDFVLAKSVTSVKRVWACAAIVAVAGIVLRASSNLVFPFLGLALVYGAMTVVGLSDRRRVFRVVEWRPFYTLSRLSYGMYLNHVIVLTLVMPGFLRAARQITGSGMVALVSGLVATVVVSILASTVLYATVERPFLLLRDRMIAKHREANPAPAEAPVSLPFPPAATVSQA